MIDKNNNTHVKVVLTKKIDIMWDIICDIW